MRVAAAAAKSLQSCLTLCDPIDGSPPGSAVPGILQARVGCHFLLQCMKVKSQSEVAQSGPTLSDPMDCSLPGPSVHGIFHEGGRYPLLSRTPAFPVSPSGLEPNMAVDEPRTIKTQLAERGPAEQWALLLCRNARG